MKNNEMLQRNILERFSMHAYQKHEYYYIKLLMNYFMYRERTLRRHIQVYKWSWGSLPSKRFPW
jgi:hypothetical protein